MLIRFWDTASLARELAEGIVSERAGLYYFIADTVLLTLNQYYGHLMGGSDAWLLYYELGAVLAISIVGLVRCFDANGAEQGRDFVMRALCLSVPIGIKLTLLGLAISWATYFGFQATVDATTFREPARVYNLVGFALVVIFSALFYWRLWMRFDQIRRHGALSS